MSSEALPYTELLRSAVASLADARGALATDEASKPSGDTIAYSLHSVITALDRLAVLSRRYSALPEFRETARGQSVAMPVVSDGAFCEAARALADRMDGCNDILGVAATRLATTIRRWIENKSPDSVRLLGSQTETAMRIMKRRVSR
jgi:hypothetical protein